MQGSQQKTNRFSRAGGVDGGGIGTGASWGGGAAAGGGTGGRGTMLWPGSGGTSTKLLALLTRPFLTKGG